MTSRIVLLFGTGVSREIDAEIASANGVDTVFPLAIDGMPFCEAVSRILSVVGERCLRYHYPEWPCDLVEKLVGGFDFADLFTLCYDDFLDSALYDPQDGFDPVGSIYEGGGAYSVFDPELVFDTEGRNSINHLNGSVLMSRHSESGTDGPMYKFDSPRKFGGFPVSEYRPVQAFSPVLVHPAGEEGFMYEPFRTYRAHLVKCLSCSRRLVVAGFLFNDPFINELIRTFSKGEGNKVFVIGDSPPPFSDMEETLFGGTDPSGRILWFRGTFKEAACSSSMCGLMDMFLAGPEKVRE